MSGVTTGTGGGNAARMRAVSHDSPGGYDDAARLP